MEKVIEGKKYGRLTPIRYSYTDKYRCKVYECKCECGNIKYVKGTFLVTGTTKSCGCLQKDIVKQSIIKYNESGKKSKGNLKHGGCNTKLYSIWSRMKSRCYSINSDNYKYYGERGIKICDEWKNDFAKFKDWALENNYKENLTIERINVNGDYEPQNCTWILFKEQIRNRRNTLMITYNNQTKPFAEWCEIYGVKYKIAHQRYKKGWNFEKIFS